jgi:hypothetical protein
MGSRRVRARLRSVQNFAHSRFALIVGHMELCYQRFRVSVSSHRASEFVGSRGILGHSD